MNIIKLQNVGESRSMDIVECIAVAGQYGEQVKFSDGSDILFLPKTSADRQLERLGLTYATAVGETLTFSRSANPKKGSAPFWDISPAGPAMSKPSTRVPSPHVPPKETVGKRQPFDEPARSEMVGMSAPPNAPLQGEDEPTPLSDKERAEDIQRRALAIAYAQLYSETLGALSAVHRIHSTVDGGIPLDSMAVQAATATVWLTWKDRGLVQGIASAALQRHADGAE